MSDTGAMSTAFILRLIWGPRLAAVAAMWNLIWQNYGKWNTYILTAFIITFHLYYGMFQWKLSDKWALNQCKPDFVLRNFLLIWKCGNIFGNIQFLFPTHSQDISSNGSCHRQHLTHSWQKLPPIEKRGLVKIRLLALKLGQLTIR